MVSWFGSFQIANFAVPKPAVKFRRFLGDFDAAEVSFDTISRVASGRIASVCKHRSLWMSQWCFEERRISTPPPAVPSSFTFVTKTAKPHSKPATKPQDGRHLVCRKEGLLTFLIWRRDDNANAGPGEKCKRGLGRPGRDCTGSLAENLLR